MKPHTRRSHLMHQALELLADGASPRDAAARAGVLIEFTTLLALVIELRKEVRSRT